MTTTVTSDTHRHLDVNRVISTYTQDDNDIKDRFSNSRPSPFLKVPLGLLLDEVSGSKLNAFYYSSKQLTSLDDGRRQLEYPIERMDFL